MFVRPPSFMLCTNGAAGKPCQNGCAAKGLFPDCTCGDPDNLGGIPGFSGPWCEKKQTTSRCPLGFGGSKCTERLPLESGQVVTMKTELGGGGCGNGDYLCASLFFRGRACEAYPRTPTCLAQHDTIVYGGKKDKDGQLHGNCYWIVHREGDRYQFEPRTGKKPGTNGYLALSSCQAQSKWYTSPLCKRARYHLRIDKGGRADTNEWYLEKNGSKFEIFLKGFPGYGCEKETYLGICTDSNAAATFQSNEHHQPTDSCIRVQHPQWDIDVVA